MSEAVEFGEKAAADRWRDEHPDLVCSIDDDARQKTVHFVSDTPAALLDQARAEADEGKAARESAIGQADLTDAEKKRIDFSEGRANVPWARSVKALAEHHGVSDWTAHADPTLTVDEHREVMERAGRQGGGARDSGEQRDADRERHAAAKQQEEGCDHARDHCEHGDPEACEFLSDACDYSEDEIERILRKDTRQATESTDQQRLVTVGGGKYPEMDVTPEQAGALQRSWQGYKGATSRLERGLNDVREEVINARLAFAAINSIRGEHDQEVLHPDDLHDLLAALNGMPGDIPEVRTLAHYGGEGGPGSGVIERDDQRTISGDRADDQARFAGNERGEKAAEVEEHVEENPGGLEADRREDTEGEQTTEQAIPDEFRGAEGGQETL